MTSSNFILHCHFMFELQMYINFFPLNLPSKIMVRLMARKIWYNTISSSATCLWSLNQTEELYVKNVHKNELVTIYL
jgi:hypothetical protein